jgi:hypothetical protein
MTTLLSWHSSDESRRCDAKCHFAQGPICDCLCGGRYHGAGLQEGELEARVEKFGKEVFEQAKLKWPEVVLGGDDEEPAPPPPPPRKKTVWEIPAKRVKKW